jgi:hypothetical protein
VKITYHIPSEQQYQQFWSPYTYGQFL